MDLLLAAGAPVDRVDATSGQTPLQDCVSSWGDLDACKALLEAGAQVNRANVDDRYDHTDDLDRVKLY